MHVLMSGRPVCWRGQAHDLSVALPLAALIAQSWNIWECLRRGVYMLAAF